MASNNAIVASRRQRLSGPDTIAAFCHIDACLENVGQSKICSNNCKGHYRISRAKEPANGVQPIDDARIWDRAAMTKRAGSMNVLHAAANRGMLGKDVAYLWQTGTINYIEAQLA